MTNRKIAYFNLISIVLLLLYMALHLFIVGFCIENVQGSEGGFSSNEVLLAKEKGFKSVSLGKNILRATTAAPASAVAILCALGEV